MPEKINRMPKLFFPEFFGGASTPPAPPVSYTYGSKYIFYGGLNIQTLLADVSGCCESVVRVKKARLTSEKSRQDRRSRWVAARGAAKRRS